MNRPNIFIMIGLSASGKSTIAKELSITYDCEIVSTDAIRGELCEGGVIDQTKNEEVFKEFHNRIKDILKSGRNVIADATNINLKSRRCLLQNLLKIDCEKIAYVIPKSIEKCIEDNIYKEYPVPHHVIQKQMMNFQIPFYEEGFDEIIIHKFENDFVSDVFINDCEERMKEFNQLNPYHTMTLGEHCKFTSALFIDKPYSAQYYIAARLHDIGKVFTQKFDEDGIAHYFQHENVGCYYLLSNKDSIVEFTGVSDDEFLDMLFLINYHMMPMSWENEKTHNTWKKRFGDYKYQLLLDFNECDKAR
jgi:predicted kinase